MKYRSRIDGKLTVSKIIPIVLWIMALCGLAVVFYSRLERGGEMAAVPMSPGSNDSEHPQGAVLVDVPWKHLPDVPRFQLMDQNNDPFDSATLAGKPYLVSFFFASCPGICRDLNRQVQRLNDQLKKEDVTFVSVSVDPENDTPEVLHRYAQDYDAQSPRWAFLTDQLYKIKELGEHIFRVEIAKEFHTENILLVDKWGRYRDRFKWNDPYDMKRLVEVVKDVAAEQQPPLDKIVHTRNVLAGQPPIDLNDVPFLRDFHLIKRDGEPFYSRDLTGQVWIANFFFVSCPGICKQQNQYLRSLRERLGSETPLLVSITTDPTHDTPEVLSQFAKTLDADQHWKFCTGQETLIQRVGSEFFGVPASQGHHSSRLFVVDRWHQVRGSFDWQEPEEEVAMLKLIHELRSETRPMPAALAKESQ